MTRLCEEIFPRLDARIDRELSAAESAAVDAHLVACAECRAEFDSRRRLKASVGRIAFPRLSLAPVAVPRPRLRRLAAAAAIPIVILLLVSTPGALPDVVALTSRMHDSYLQGLLAPRDLGLKSALPGATYVGHCDCPPELGPASPFIVYRRGETPISLLISDTDPGPLPSHARRVVQGHDFYVFQAGGNHAVVCRSGRFCHVWVSRLDEETLLRTIQATQVGKLLLSGESTTLEGVACYGCCCLLESRVRKVEGVKDAAIDIASMELVVTPSGGKVDLERVLQAVREAGFEARKR